MGRVGRGFGREVGERGPERSEIEARVEESGFNSRGGQWTGI
jgi:hypothetical protein